MGKEIITYVVACEKEANLVGFVVHIIATPLGILLHFKIQNLQTNMTTIAIILTYLNTYVNMYAMMTCTIAWLSKSL